MALSGREVFRVFADLQTTAWLVHLVEQRGEPGHDRFLNGAGEVDGCLTAGPGPQVHGAGVGQDRGAVGHLYPHVMIRS